MDRWAFRDPWPPRWTSAGLLCHDFAFTHELLARAVVLEQVYRAYAIVRGFAVPAGSEGILALPISIADFAENFVVSEACGNLECL